MSYEFVWTFISYFADIAYWIGFSISFLIVYQLMERKDRSNVSWVIYALLPAVLLAAVMKEVLERIFLIPRPCAGMLGCPSGYSFPSGHASIIFAFAAIVSVYGKKYRSYLWAVPLAVLVGLSRIALNYHTPVDVLGGAVVGIVSGVITYKLSGRLQRMMKRTGVLGK